MAGSYAETLEGKTELLLSRQRTANDRLKNIEDALLLVADRLTQVLAQEATTQKEIEMARKEFDDAVAELKVKLQRSTDVMEGAVTAFKDVSAQLQDAIKDDDIATIKAISVKLNEEAEALAAALVKGTPADPNTPPADPIGPTI